MAIHTAALNLLTFPQRWDAAARELVVRVLCLPVGNPRAALAPGQPAFDTADLRFEAHRVGSLAHVPRAADASASGLLALQDPPRQKALVFEQLGAQFEIDAGPAPLAAGPAMRFRKPLTDSYRKLAGNRRLGDELIDSDQHECALHDAHAGQPAAPVQLKSSLRWGQLIAYALRQPTLATALGLMGELRVPLDEGAFAQGGWLWLAPHASGDFAADPALLALYAARIPPLLPDVSRTVYAPVLFPVDRADFRLDEVLRDAERYEQGFARMVHGAQGDAPALAGGQARDAIRLAWDDEQVARWFTRQLAADSGAPMGTAGFRVDVRLAGEAPDAAAGDWHSLQRQQSLGELTVGTAVLGPFVGEGMVEVVPAQLSPAHAGEFWMPAYFTAWRGASLLLTDTALARLAQPLDGEAAFDPRYAGLLPDREKTFVALDDKAVKLRYGRAYDFRVRLADLTGGGPGPEVATPPSPDGDAHLTTSVPFRRHCRPGAVTVLQRPARDRPLLRVEKPRLGFPEILYASGIELADDEIVDALRAARRDDAAVGLTREPGLPDPDVSRLAIELQVRALVGDGEVWQSIHRSERSFDTPTLELPLRYDDVAQLANFALADDGTLALPTARDLRLLLSAVGRDGAGYFGSDAARLGPPTVVEFSIVPAAEAALFQPREQPLLGFFFRTPPAQGPTPPPAQRLAQELGLQSHGLTLTGRAGRRTVFAASDGLRHTLSPECSSLTLASDAELAQRWIVVLRLRIARDWSWRGAAEPLIEVRRQVARGGAAPAAAEVVGTLRLPKATAANAAAGLAAGDARDGGRQFTDLVFLDALDPKPRAAPQPEDGEFPDELQLSYELQPAFAGLAAMPPAETLPLLRLPVTTAPNQLPRLLSAGIALSPYVAAADYSSTEVRQRMLWLEFEQGVIDPRDRYVVRVLANAPDPLLTDEVVDETAPEPPLGIDSEWLRLVQPGQSADDSGSQAMSALGLAAEGGRHFLLPLPDGLSESASELFDLFSCEIRVAHDDSRWCTAQGRFGPALRVAGLQHPPPPLACHPARLADGVRVRATLATPLLQGRHVRPLAARTRLWALLYARVQQADGNAWRNVLLQQRPLQVPVRDPFLAAAALPLLAAQPALLIAEGHFPLAEVRASLRLYGLPDDAPLTAMTVEFYTAPEVADPLGRELGQARLLRASALVPVPDAC